MRCRQCVPAAVSVLWENRDADSARPIRSTKQPVPMDSPFDRENVATIVCFGWHIWDPPIVSVSSIWFHGSWYFWSRLLRRRQVLSFFGYSGKSLMRMSRKFIIVIIRQLSAITDYWLPYADRIRMACQASAHRAKSPLVYSTVPRAWTIALSFDAPGYPIAATIGERLHFPGAAMRWFRFRISIRNDSRAIDGMFQ